MRILLLPWILVITLFVTYAFLSACRDTLQHHWSDSIFYRWSKGDKTAYWGHADEVWKRRYVDRDPKRGFLPIMSNIVTKQLLVMVWDGWHLLKTLEILCLCILATMALNIGVFWAVLFFVLFGAPFELMYKMVRL